MTIKIEKSGGKARFKANDQEFLVADEGNVGIGTDTPTAKLDVVGQVAFRQSENTAPFVYNQSNVSPLQRFNGVVPSVDLRGPASDGRKTLYNFRNGQDAGGSGDEEAGVALKLSMRPSSGQTDSRKSATLYVASDDNFNNNPKMGLALGHADVLRFTSGRHLKVSHDGNFVNPAGTDYSEDTAHTLVGRAVSATSLPALRVLNDGPNGHGIHVEVNRATSANFLFKGFVPISDGAGGTVMEERINIDAAGSLRNLNNSYGAISDIKLKENITDSTPKLDDIAALRFVNYNLKSQPDTKQFGVIAQELEEIFPALVETTPDVDDEGNETGEVTKSVKYSVLTLMAVKALQEANDKITALEERLAALEAGN